MYAGAWQAYLGDRVPQVYMNSMRVTTPAKFFVLDAQKFADIMREWFPMAVHLLEGLFFGIAEHRNRSPISENACWPWHLCPPDSPTS